MAWGHKMGIGAVVLLCTLSFKFGLLLGVWLASPEPDPNYKGEIYVDGEYYDRGL